LTQEQAFRWYLLQAGEYTLQQPDELEIVGSQVFPGLQLAVESSDLIDSCRFGAS
jgi:Uma2 family endonuclease